MRDREAGVGGGSDRCVWAQQGTDICEPEYKLILRPEAMAAGTGEEAHVPDPRIIGSSYDSSVYLFLF